MGGLSHLGGAHPTPSPSPDGNAVHGNDDVPSPSLLAGNGNSNCNVSKQEDTSAPGDALFAVIEAAQAATRFRSSPRKSALTTRLPVFVEAGTTFRTTGEHRETRMMGGDILVESGRSANTNGNPTSSSGNGSLCSSRADGQRRMKSSRGF